MNSLEAVINETFDNRASLDLPNADSDIKNAVRSAIDMLDSAAHCIFDVTVCIGEI